MPEMLYSYKTCQIVYEICENMSKSHQSSTHVTLAQSVRIQTNLSQAKIFLTDVATL